jgi:predicted nicotinamide N-methyase
MYYHDKSFQNFPRNMEDALQESLIPLKHGLLISQALPALTFFESSLRTAVKQLGVPRVTQICDTYIRDEIRSTSLNALLLHYLEKYPDDLGEICERCISCITPDTVACGALRGRMVSVDIIPNVIKFDVSLGEFYDEWTGSRIWPGAIHLSRKLLHRGFTVTDCNVLELGSGLGICGMAALHSGANHVAFTEHKDTLLDCCKQNVDTNNPSDHHFRTSFINLNWCDFDPISHAGFQNFKASNTSKELVVIGSEVVYEESHAPIVISVLTKLFSHGFTRGLICIMTKPSRIGLDKFISLLQALLPDCPFHCSIEEEPDPCEPDQIPVFIQLYRTLVYSHFMSLYYIAKVAVERIVQWRHFDVRYPPQ